MIAQKVVDAKHAQKPVVGPQCVAKCIGAGGIAAKGCRKGYSLGLASGAVLTTGCPLPLLIATLRADS